MRNPLCLYRAKYYRAERTDAAFVSPPFTDCETADKWLTRKLSEGATGGTIEIAYVDVPSSAWELPAIREVGAA